MRHALETIIPAENNAPAQARAMAEQFAAGYDLASRSNLALIISELVTNSVVHGPGRPITLRLRISDDGVLQGEVEDHGDGALEKLADARGQGFGLRLVDQLSRAWGHYPGSTHVWFELAMRPVAG